METIENEPQIVSDSLETSAVASLRTTRAAFEADLKLSGNRAGKQFVMVNPDFSKLKRLQRWQEAVNGDYSYVSTFGDLAKIMTAGKECGDDIEQQVRESHGSDIDEPVWIDAFIEAALDQFAELEPKL
jgi:hypothetical protein